MASVGRPFIYDHYLTSGTIYSGGEDGSRTRLDGFAGRISSLQTKYLSENRSFAPHEFACSNTSEAHRYYLSTSVKDQVECSIPNRIFLMMIELQFLSTDPDEIELAKRYWSISEDGKFAHNVSKLLPFRSLKTTSQLTSLLRSVVVAKDLNQRCSQCEQPGVLTSRSQLQTRGGTTRHPCSTCKAAAELAKRAAIEEAARALTHQLDALTQRKLSSRFDFDSLPDHAALLLLAVDKAISPRLAEGTFTEKDCRFVAPCDVGSFIAKLIEHEALIVRPDLSPSGTYMSDNGQLSYYPSKAVYQMTAASSNVSRATALATIRQRDFGASVGLAELWLDLATAECMRYLHDQSEMHNLPIDWELRLQLSSVIRVAAESYSVAELWNVIWKVVRDAATLSRRDYYNPTKAAATLPGKIRRHLEKEKKGEVTLKPWDRPDHQPSGTLGELFAEIFDIDEQTTGLMAMDVLSSSAVPLEKGPAQNSSATDRHHADQLFLAASGHGATLEVLVAFTEAVINGLSTPEAISYVTEALPYLNDPY